MNRDEDGARHTRQHGQTRDQERVAVRHQERFASHTLIDERKRSLVRAVMAPVWQSLCARLILRESCGAYLRRT